MTTDLESLEANLRELGYPHPTLKEGGDNPSISGSIYDIDFSDTEKSVPTREGTGPFATLDNPEDLIPEDITSLCEQYGATPQVLGHNEGEQRLHIYIS